MTTPLSTLNAADLSALLKALNSDQPFTPNPPLVPGDSPTLLTPVKPGDPVHSALINELIAEFLQVKQNIPDTRLTLGPLAQGARTLLALGTGFETTGGIYLDGQPLLSPIGRGISLAVLDASLTLKFADRYDTWGSTAEAARLANDLTTRAAARDLVVGVTHDAFALNLTVAAKQALAAIGAATLAQVPANSRANAAFIGVVPATRGVAYDFLMSCIPADGLGFGGQLLMALPSVWGLYSPSLTRFILTGGTNNSAPAPAPSASGPSAPIINKTTEVIGSFDNVNVLTFLNSSQQTKLKTAGFNTVQDLVDASDAKLTTALGLKQKKQVTDLRAKLNQVLGG